MREIPENSLDTDQQRLVQRHKQSRSRLGYYPILAAAVPAMIVSNTPKAPAVYASKTEDDVAEHPTSLPQRSLINRSNAGLLKQQSKFRPTPGRGIFNVLTALNGNDDCPGRIIPGATYTAASPYVDTGDTSGANDTVNYFFGFYYGYEASGPDVIYSFTMKDRGPHPRIEVTSTSGSYRPLIYILDDGNRGPCPAGTGNTSSNAWFAAFAGSNGVATIDADIMQFLPLNVPFHLFIDARNEAAGAGPYTLRMQDITVAPQSCLTLNPIDCTDFIVRQHYLDFLNREADSAGLTSWSNEINLCRGDSQCVEVKRINVSAAFFLSIEFQRTGYLVYRTHAVAFGPTRIGSTVPLTRAEFVPDALRVGQGVIVGITGWEAQLEANQTAYLNEFVQRQDFMSTYPSTMSGFEFVDALNAHTGNALTMSERDQLAEDLIAGRKTRAQVLRAVVDNQQFSDAEFNRAFVLMQYFGYLRRNPNDAPDQNFDGYNFWLSKLNQFNGNFIEAEMVKAFLTSIEYRQRFGQP